MDSLRPPSDKRFHDLTGRSFGRLKAKEIVSISRFPAGGIKYVWRFDCACGNSINVVAINIVAGRQTCCGCRRA